MLWNKLVTHYTPLAGQGKYNKSPNGGLQSQPDIPPPPKSYHNLVTHKITYQEVV